QAWHVFKTMPPEAGQHVLRFTLANPAPLRFKEARLTGVFFQVRLRAEEGNVPVVPGNYTIVMELSKVKIDCGIPSDAVQWIPLSPMPSMKDVVGNCSIRLQPVNSSGHPADGTSFDIQQVEDMLLILVFEG